MRKLPDILDTKAGPNFLCQDHLTPFLKTQVVHESGTIKIHDAIDKPIHIIGSINLYVHVGRMTELVNFLVCERLAVSAILGCDFCDQFVECIYSKTRSVELVDGSTLPIVRHYCKQRSAVTKSSKVFSFSERKGRVSPQIRSTQRVRVSPLSQAMITVQAERECQILVTPRTPAAKRIKCSAACKIQNVKRHEPFRILVANDTGEKKNNF